MNAMTQADIIREKIEVAEQGIYSATIDKRVADKCGDEKMAANAVELAKKWERIKDILEEMLRGVQPKE